MQQTTVMSVFKRYATTAYDGWNLSILRIESLSPPNSSKINPLDFRTIFTAILTPGLTNSVDDTASIVAGLYYIGWALRAYQDEFTTNSQLPLTVLRGLLTVPIQFATMAWEWVNLNATATTSTTEFALPPDLEATASIARRTYRAKAKPRTVCVFIGLTSLLLIWCNSVLLWILRQKTASPNLSDFVEVDIASKATAPIEHSQVLNQEGDEMEDLEDWSTRLRRVGLGNAQTKSVVQNLKNSNIRVAGVRSVGNEINLVLVTASRHSTLLQNATNLEKVKTGHVYK